MIFPATRGTTTFGLKLGANHLGAERVKQEDFNAAYDILFPGCNKVVSDILTSYYQLDEDEEEDKSTSLDELLQQVERKRNAFEGLFVCMCHTYDLTVPQGWAKLLKRLLVDSDKPPPFASIQNLTAVTLSLFSSKINISIAFLAGEAPIIAFMQKLLSAESPFPLEYQISAHLNVLKERSLDQSKLKQFSHEQQ
ncbi:unnamed protein product [Cylindrotheca closterium]|uniref:Uncharacterized protein n=1 Tax=Cylindrotheca closterium TaxID=2856 RepID=A0AAD2GF44_9STRA|nr:unnamed protein product [Cylindrotheca closterium]